MESFKRLNTLAGWQVFGIAFIVYAITMEETASFWDCGEFIAVSYKLEVPHPPGAPFYLLIGRLFSFLAILSGGEGPFAGIGNVGDLTMISYWINMLSVLSSAFTILFLHWTIVFLGRKIIKAKEGAEYSPAQAYLLVGGGVVGALAYTFSDSFWFSAVEAEVYAMSSFFTAFVFWAMLKWEYIEDDAAANRWLLMIFYMMGLSIGVHLLNLVTIPALALIYLFKKRPKANRNMVIGAMAIGLGIILVIMYGVIPGLPSLAGMFEVTFVNDLGLPFGSGMIAFLILLFGGLLYTIWYSQKNGKLYLNLFSLAFAFILIGYSSYLVITIRSDYNPPINENDPSDLISFVKYLKREQYGDRPLVYGQTFDAERVDVVRGAPVYRKGKDRYEVYDYKTEPVYDPKNMMLLPRIYSQQPGHADLYRERIGLRKGEKPTFADNLYYMFSYQMGHMYFRYFMWNFAGRESDEKEAQWLLPWDAFEDIPEEMEMNKGRANFFLLPFILGVLGMFFHQQKDNTNFWITMLLFFLTGLALILYLNSPPTEPRERDYIYAGSFYVFSIWIGFGVYAIGDLLKNILKGKTLPIVATVIGLIIPGIMGANGWESHNRSNRFHSIDQAKNTLRSCAPNAILFTGGDNDTFPLWYVQEVENFRTDVRVAVLSYFSTDWYISQMRRQQYESDPLPFSIDQKNYASGKNDYVPLLEDAKARGGVNLKTYLKLVNQNDPRVLVPLSDGSYTAKLLSSTFVLEVDSAKVAAMDFVPESKKGRIEPQMVWALQQGYQSIYKNELALLDLIATNNWERPIYFNNTSANTLNMDLRNYLQMEGMTFRLMPIRSQDDGAVGEVNLEAALENIKQFEFRGFDDPNAYHDDEYKKFGSNTRNVFYRVASELSSQGREKEAEEVLDMALEKIPDYSIPYSFFMPRYVDLYHELGAHDKAKEIGEVLSRRAKENLEYIARTRQDNESLRQRSLLVLQQLVMIYRQYEQFTARKIEFLESDESSILEESTKPDSEEIQKLKEELKMYEAELEKYNDIFYKSVEGLENSIR